uniref:Uncharacterized protein n=1 Tax=Setaria viridis TaxID=4556 RepID=A0A4U6USG6_SETVI|nr:hypothetical protein SEVIR_5G136500v2 [Setaria viridis]
MHTTHNRSHHQNFERQVVFGFHAQEGEGEGGRERGGERGLGMAAIRSALALLGRRSCGPSRSAAVASLGGTGLEMHQVFRPAAPRTPPLPSLLPARHSLESYRRLSTGGRVPADKAEKWWQRPEVRFWYSVIVLGSTMCCIVKVRMS